ncbi:MAG: hypothetical protein KJ737_00515 [Proteobacteria bacterium]|nr:hypothetical protein [Pseudomonadota bacterium]
MTPEIDELLKQGWHLKQGITSRTEKLREINSKIAALACFKDGKKTGYLESDKIKAKISLSSTVKWDQEKLKEAMPHFQNFHDVFKPEYKPVSKKTLDLACAANPEFKRAIDWASEVKDNTPSVTYELIEEVADA